jgi:hypothetical protein
MENKKSPHTPPEYLSLRALSARSSLSIKTLRTFLYDPKCPLPHYRMTRKILVKVEEFDAWLARFRVQHPGVDLGKIMDEFMRGMSVMVLPLLFEHHLSVLSMLPW